VPDGRDPGRPGRLTRVVSAGLPVRKNTDVLGELVDVAGLRVIDVGCGAGGLVRWLAGRGAHVTGLECQRSQLEKARAVARVADEDYVEGIGEAMPFPDASADLVVFFQSLHHVPADEMRTALREAARVLRPGGLAYVSEPIAEGDFFELVRPVDDETDVRRLACEAIADSERHGLEQVSEHRFLHPLVFADFDAFCDLIVGADGARASTVAALGDDLRRRFETSGRATEPGRAFESPTRVNLLRRP
jgi:SAM-dependent methyltransferase